MMLADLPNTSALWASSSAIWPALRNTFVLPICKTKLRPVNGFQRLNMGEVSQIKLGWKFNIETILKYAYKQDPK